MAKKSKGLVTFRFPYSGDKYTAEGKHRIRVERGNQWGYFDDCGRWLEEGPLQAADPCFCRFLSSSWIIDQDRPTWAMARRKPAPKPRRAKTRAKHR